MSGSETVVVLPETNNHTLCLEFTGLIRAEDHRRNLQSNLQKMINRDGWFNMLIHYSPDFRGFEKDAASTSMQSIIDQGKYARRLAYVNPPEKKILQNKLAAPLFTGEIRYFGPDDMDEALEWVKSG